LVFVYAAVSIYVIREFLLHYLIAHTNGHLHGDALYYHQLALEQLEKLKRLGFSEFDLRPQGQGPAGITSLLYYVNTSPLGIVLLNSLLHAVSTLFLYKIIRLEFRYEISMISVLPFLISPYLMHWFSQINKDSFSCAGIMMTVYGLVCLIQNVSQRTFLDHFKSLLFIGIGIFLIWIVRPYINQLMLPFVIGVLVYTFFYSCYKCASEQKPSLKIYANVVSIFAVIFFLSVMNKGAASDKTLKSLEEPIAQSRISNLAEGMLWKDCLKNVSENFWENLDLAPDYFNKKVKALIGQRCYMFSSLENNLGTVTTYSFIDQKVLPKGTVEAIQYLPQAFLNGVFTPWPKDWLKRFDGKISFFYLFASLEAIILYITLPFLLLSLFWNWKVTRLIPVMFSCYMITIIAMATPFIGALYRYRYPWWMLLLCFSLAATLQIVSHLYRSKKVTL